MAYDDSITTTTTTTTTTVDISELTILPDFQVRRKGTQEYLVKRYANALRAGQTLPPIKAVRGENGCLIVYDGHHTVKAIKDAAELYRDNRISTLVDVEIKSGTFTPEQIKSLAYRANSAHGLSLTSPERFDWFCTYIRAKENVKPNGRLMSYREIEEDLRIPKSTVQRWMPKYFPSVAEKMAGGMELFQRTANGGLAKMERSTTTEYMQSLNSLIDKINALEAMGSKKAPELRRRLLDDLSKASERLVAAGVAAPEQEEF